MANPSCGTLDKPGKRKKAKQGVRKQSKKAVRMTDCDRVWPKVIKALFGGRCAVCGNAGRTEAHHLIGRRQYLLRHSLTNGILLCFQHHKGNKHLSAHEAPWAFEKWMKEHRPEHWEWWQENRWKVFPKPNIDYAAVLETLKEQLAKMETRE